MNGFRPSGDVVSLSAPVYPHGFSAVDAHRFFWLARTILGNYFLLTNKTRQKKKKKKCLCFQNYLVRERFISSLVTFVVQLITVGKKMIISLKLVVGCCCIFSSVAHPVDVFSAFTSLRSLFVIQTFFSFVFLKKNLPKRCFSSPVRTCRAHYRTLFTFSQIREKTFRLNWAGVHNGA